MWARSSCRDVSWQGFTRHHLRSFVSEPKNLRCKGLHAIICAVLWVNQRTCNARVYTPSSVQFCEWTKEPAMQGFTRHHLCSSGSEPKNLQRKGLHAIICAVLWVNQRTCNARVYMPSSAQFCEWTKEPAMQGFTCHHLRSFVSEPKNLQCKGLHAIICAVLWVNQRTCNARVYTPSSVQFCEWTKKPAMQGFTRHHLRSFVSEPKNLQCKGLHAIICAVLWVNQRTSNTRVYTPSSAQFCEWTKEPAMQGFTRHHLRSFVSEPKNLQCKGLHAIICAVLWVNQRTCNARVYTPSSVQLCGWTKEPAMQGFTCNHLCSSVA